MAFLTILNRVARKSGSVASLMSYQQIRFPAPAISVCKRWVSDHETLLTRQVLRNTDIDEDSNFHPTSVTIMNEDKTLFYIDSISNVGFTLNSGSLIFGPIALFPNAVLSWNIAGVHDINEKSLTFFSLIEPKIDILVLGYGHAQEQSLLNQKVFEGIRKQGITVECLPTEKAVAMYNFLVAEKRLVAGAFLPVANLSSVDVYMPLDEDKNEHSILDNGDLEPMTMDNLLLKSPPKNTGMLRGKSKLPE